MGQEEPKSYPPNSAMAEALLRTLESPNEMDRNGESANVVDALFAIARAINLLAGEVRASRLKAGP